MSFTGKGPQLISSIAVKKEQIIPLSASDLAGDSPFGVEVRTFVSEARGASAFSTGLATFQPGAGQPHHVHAVSEAMTVVTGQAYLVVGERDYRLASQDCAHIPAGVPHRLENHDPDAELTVHFALASARPSSDLANRDYPVEERGLGEPSEKNPETIVRFDQSAVYELSDNAFFTDLFARRLGAVGICGGYGRFLPGASLPCHTHDFDESITIVKGSATCLVQGREYQMNGCATAYIPKGIPHRFVNNSVQEMAMIWVYAGDEPDRRIVESGYCSGSVPWNAEASNTVSSNSNNASDGI